MKSRGEIINRVREEARRRGVRWTTQRQAIVETFIASTEHLTVDDLHHRVRRIDPTVSAATVYRTIHLLVDLQVASRGHFFGGGSGSASYECNLNKQHHDHLVCLVCGRIQEFTDPRIEQLQDETARAFGFRLSHHRMELYGNCRECQAKILAGEAAHA